MEIADAAIRLFDLAGSLQPTMPPFTPYPVAQCSKDTMLDVLMDLTGDLWVSSNNVQMDRKDTLGIGIMRVLGSCDQRGDQVRPAGRGRREARVHKRAAAPPAP
jgi:hypothetical protein